MAKRDVMFLMWQSYNERIKEFKAKRAKETNPKRIKILDEVIQQLIMKAKHSIYVHKEGIEIYKAMEAAAKNNPNGKAMTKQQDILSGLTNKQAFEIAKKHFHDYELALMGHDIGRVLEFDRKGITNFKSHPYLSYEMMADQSDISRVATINHGYSTAEAMYSKMNDKESARTAIDNNGHADWMRSLQLDAFNKYQSMPHDDKVATMLLSYMIRDADKLGNWKGVVQHGDNENSPTMQKIYALPHGNKDGIKLSEREMSAVRENRTMKYFEDVTHFIGMYLAVAMWAPDFALNVTAKAAAKSNLVSGLIDNMNEIGQDKAIALKKPDEYAELVNQLLLIFNTKKQRGFISADKTFDVVGHLRTLEQMMTGKRTRPKLALNGLRKYVKEDTV